MPTDCSLKTESLGTVSHCLVPVEVFGKIQMCISVTWDSSDWPHILSKEGWHMHLGHFVMLKLLMSPPKQSLPLMDFHLQSPHW